MSPEFSVVIPLYNKAGTILTTVNSVLNQTFSAFEIVVVDDGSTDGGVSCLSRVQDSRLKIVRQDNSGVSSARNLGIQNSIAEHIAFLDADDLWYPQHLEELHGLIQQYPDCGIYSTAHHISRGGKKYLPNTGFKGRYRGYVTDVFRTFSNGLALVNSSTACVKKCSIERNGTFPVGAKTGEDVYVWLNIAHHDHMAHSNRVTAVYNQEMPTRVISEESSQIPYYFGYLDDLRISPSLDAESCRSVTKLLSKCIILTSANLTLTGNKAMLGSLGEMKIVAESRLLRFWLLCLRLVPTSCLRMAKRFRHKKSD